MKKNRVLPILPIITLIVLFGPVAAGLWGTLMPAFGHFPTAGLSGPNLDGFRSLFEWPGFARAAWLSIFTGFASTILALLIVVFLTAGWAGTRVFQWLERLLSPLLSIPHAAAAFGFAFLIAPSGWIARALSPWLTGWDRPLDLLIVNDTYGIAMIVGLVVKEMPFLLLMTLAALGQTNLQQARAISASLGYGRVTGWLKTVFPRVYRQIRLPVYVVLAYAMSVVDVAIILGPNTPSTLSVQIVRWMGDPDIAMRVQAASAAMVQLALVLAALLMWRIGEVIVGRLGMAWVYAGKRGAKDAAVRWSALLFGGASAGFVILGLLILAVWSFAGFWGFPDTLPQSFSFKSWMRHADGVSSAFGETALIALIVTAIALLLAIGCLEAEHRYGLRLSQRGIWLLYLPLLIPQTAFLPGLQTFMLGIGAETGRLPVIAAHVVFVFPYVFLSLSDPFRAWDARMGVTALTLGASPDRVLWTVRLPMLLRPVLTAVAVGMAVSVGQYLATLLIGGGRVQTLTTEAVALTSGGDRRAIGVYALMQTAAALVPFTFALLLPAIIWRNRKGLKIG